MLGLTHSGTQLGPTTAARFLPMFLFGPLAAAIGLTLCFACNAASFGAV